MSNDDSMIDEESVMFETQMIQFDQDSDTNKSGGSEYGRRSGVKKVDDEHLIRLAARTASENKRRKELEEKQHRTDFIKNAFKRLTEDG